MQYPRQKKHRLPDDVYVGRVTVSFTACIEDRRTPFVSAEMVRAQIEMLSRAVNERQCAVVYCFMPDHQHAVIFGLSDSSEPKKAMSRFKYFSGNWFEENAQRYRWQSGFYDHIVRGGEDWRSHLRYVLHNPVRAGLCGGWEEYPFTGAIECDLHELMW